MSLKPVCGSRGVEGGGTQTGRLAARQRGHPPTPPEEHDPLHADRIRDTRPMRHRRISRALALGGTSGGIGPGGRVFAEPGHGDDMERAVELAVPGVVEPMAGELPGGSRDRAHTCQGRKRRLGMQPACRRPAHQHLRSADGPNAVHLQQPRGDGMNQRGQFSLEFFGLGLQQLDAMSSGPQRADSGAVLQRPGRAIAQAGAVLDLAGGVLRPRSSARSSSGAPTISALGRQLTYERLSTAEVRIFVSAWRARSRLVVLTLRAAPPIPTMRHSHAGQ